jgi:hypothetical protein
MPEKGIEGPALLGWNKRNEGRRQRVAIRISCNWRMREAIPINPTKPSQCGSFVGLALVPLIEQRV